MKTAESALDEANVMDIKNEEVWAYLTVVNIKMGNDDEAKVCYARALEVITILYCDYCLCVSFGVVVVVGTQYSNFL